MADSIVANLVEEIITPTIVEEIIQVNFDAGVVPATSVQIKSEVPSGAINGVNATFTSASAFDGSTLEVFKNGQKLTVIDDFNITNSTTFVLTISPLTLDKLSINYTQL